MSRGRHKVRPVRKLATVGLPRGLERFAARRRHPNRQPVDRRKDLA